MRLNNFVLDVKTATVVLSASQFIVDSVSPATRQIKKDVYPLPGDVNSTQLRVFQGATQKEGSTFINMHITGAMDSQHIINSNGTMKMTASLSAPTEIAQDWGVLMVANSIFVG